jgi:predicted esterase
MRVTHTGATGRRALLLVLHDAGASARQGLSAFRGGWGSPGLVLLAPSSHGTSWSFERGRGSDLAPVSRALTQAVAQCPVDSRRIGIGGFAAGATSALSLGLTNGRLFHAIVALSPDAIETRQRAGRPRVFVALARSGAAAHFAQRQTVLVPTLRREGYAVTFRAFAGGRSVPTAVSQAAVRWFLR